MLITVKLAGAVFGALPKWGCAMLLPKSRLSALVAGVLLSLSLLHGAARAQTEPAGVTRQEVAAWLAGEGHPPNIHNDSHGESIVSSSIDGVNFDIYFYACTGERCTSVQFAAGWTPLAKATPDAVNAWNRDKRYVKAYLDHTNNLWGEYDIDLTASAYPQLHKALARFDSSIVEFKTYFGG